MQRVARVCQRQLILVYFTTGRTGLMVNVPEY